VAKCGGLSIYAATVAALWMTAPRTPEWIGYAVAATLLVAWGVIDDVKGLSPPVKILGQVIAASIVASTGTSIESVPWSALSVPLTIFWIVLVTNAVNLLDNMDGLSAGITIITAAIFLVITAAQAQIFSAMIFALLTGAILGFLLHNFYPAKIFMGDAGSLFLGYLLAALSLTSSYVVPTSVNLLPVLTPLLILSLPIFDTLSVMFIRRKEGRPLFIGDRRHFSHRLVELGMSQRGAVIFIYLVAISIGVAAALLPYLPLWGQILVLLQTVALYIMITILMHVAKRRHLENGLNNVTNAESKAEKVINRLK
ncbi:MAG: MraY family glycosyltransferase, partial [bacterium]